MNRKLQSSNRLYGLTQGREIFGLAQAGLHSIHKNRGKSACTLSVPRELATSSFKSFGVNCCSKHFWRTTTHLQHTLYGNTARWNPLLELPVDCLPEPCSSRMLRTGTFPLLFGQLWGPRAALSRRELLASLCPCHCTWSERDRLLTCCMSQGSNMGCSPHGPNFRLFIKYIEKWISERCFFRDQACPQIAW